MKVKIYFQNAEGDPPKLLSPMDAEENTTLLALRRRLEELNVFRWLGRFQFWDVEECCRIDGDFEDLNSIRDCIHLIPADSDLEVNCSKRPRLGSIGESTGTRNDVGDSMRLEPTGVELEPTEIRLTDPVPTTEGGASEEHSCTGGELLKSTLLPRDVLQWYLNAEEKLRGDLKVQAMDDHVWSLRSWDQDGVAVVKLFCGECRSFIGGNTSKHSKNTVSNLFSNFRKSHLISARHIHSYCCLKGMKFHDHPQSGSSRSNPIELTVVDHKKREWGFLRL